MRRDVINEFRQFVLNQAHVLSRYPELMSQQAHNQETWPAVSSAASRALAKGSERRPWLRLIWSTAVGARSHSTLPQHEKAVTACAFSPTGETVVTGDTQLEDFRDETTMSYRDPDPWKYGRNTIRMFRFPDLSRETETAHTDQGGVSCLDFSPDGRTLIAGLWDGTLRQLDGCTLEHRSVLDRRDGSSDEGVSCCRFSPDGQSIVYCSRNLGRRKGTPANFLRILDVRSGEVLVSRNCSSGVNSCAWSPDGQLVAAACEDGSVSIFEAAGLREVRTLAAHDPGPAYCCAFIAQPRILVSGGRDGRLCLWDLDSPEKTWYLDDAGYTLSLAVSADGALIASGGYDHTVKLWEVGTGRCLSTLYEHGDFVPTLCFSPDGGYLCSGSADRLVKLWDVEEVLGAVPPGEDPGFIADADLSWDGHECVIATSSGTLRRFDLESRAEHASLETSTPGIRFSKYVGFDRSVLFGGAGRALSIWRGASTEPVRGLDAPGRESPEMMLSRQSFDWSRCHVVPATRRAYLQNDMQTAVVVPSEGAIVAIRQHRSLMNPYLWSHAVSPDGRYVLTGDEEGKLREFDLVFGDLAREKIGRFIEYVNCASYSPDGNMIAVATGSGSRSAFVGERATLHLVNPKTRERAFLEGHENTSDVAGCQFLADGMHISSATKAGEVFVWSLREERPICRAYLDGAIQRLAALGDRVLVRTPHSAYVFQIQGVELGAPIVTPRRKATGTAVTCVSCGFESPVEGIGSGEESVCPQCGAARRLSALAAEEWERFDPSTAVEVTLQRALRLRESDAGGTVRELETLPQAALDVPEISEFKAVCHAYAGVEAHHRGDWSRAKEHWRQAAELAPENREIRRLLKEANVIEQRPGGTPTRRGLMTRLRRLVGT